jgi:hypothetical protein
MNEINSSLANDFSITRGGPLHRLLVRLGQASEERRLVVHRALFFVLVTWLPLLVLSLLERLAYEPNIKIPFLRDFAVNVRFLVAAPILILAESGIDQRWRTLVLQFLRSGLVAEKELFSFEMVIERTTRLRDRILPEALLIVAAFFPSIFRVSSELLISQVSSWHTLVAGSGELSLAGWWFKLVSTPLFRFLLLRWVWRMFLWTLFLWRVSRVKLHLVATHTDMAAGLGFLSQGQKAFSPIVFAGGAVIAAGIGNSIAYGGATLSTMKLPMIAYGVLAIILLIVPLLVVTPILLKTKKKALIEYGALVTIHNQLFDGKWIQNQRPADEVILGHPDVSSLADLGSSFAVVRRMGLVPIDKPTLISLAVAAGLPIVPLILLATPADELIHVVLKLLG